MEARTAATDRTSELDAPRWAVISFESCEAASLTFDAAESLLRELQQKGVAGLSIVTNETAARVKK